jgi:hypothetical protein
MEFEASSVTKGIRPVRSQPPLAVPRRVYCHDESCQEILISSGSDHHRSQYRRPDPPCVHSRLSPDPKISETTGDFQQFATKGRIHSGNVPFFRVNSSPFGLWLAEELSDDVLPAIEGTF